MSDLIEFATAQTNFTMWQLWLLCGATGMLNFWWGGFTERHWQRQKQARPLKAQPDKDSGQ